MKRDAQKTTKKPRAHRYQWVVEELTDQPSFFHKAMFGCEACYVHGRLMLVLAGTEEPWRGLLVPTAREHHRALRAAHPELTVHPVLGKWLYLSEAVDDFESAAMAIVSDVVSNDTRIGV